MGFINKNETQTVLPIVEDTFTNAICYGQTGSGKTTGFMLQNIENRIKLGHGILIYDFKGNFHEQVKVLASKHYKLNDLFDRFIWSLNFELFSIFPIYGKSWTFDSKWLCSSIVIIHS